MLKSGLGKDWDTFKNRALTGRLAEKDNSTKIEIDFTEFIATLSEPQNYFFHTTETLNLLYTGQGGGKTHVAGGKALELITRFPEMRGLICANTVKQLKQSTLRNMRETWRKNFNR